MHVARRVQRSVEAQVRLRSGPMLAGEFCPPGLSLGSLRRRAIRFSRRRADAVTRIYAMRGRNPDSSGGCTDSLGTVRASPRRWPPNAGSLRLDSLRLADRIRLRSARGYSPGRGGIAT